MYKQSRWSSWVSVQQKFSYTLLHLFIVSTCYDASLGSILVHLMLSWITQLYTCIFKQKLLYKYYYHPRKTDLKWYSAASQHWKQQHNTDVWSVFHCSAVHICGVPVQSVCLTWRCQVSTVTSWMMLWRPWRLPMHCSYAVSWWSVVNRHWRHSTPPLNSSFVMHRLALGKP